MNIEWLKNKLGQKFYPLTHAKAVLVGENNETLDTELDGIKNDLEQVQSSLSIPGIYELLSETTLDLRSETSQSFSLLDNPGNYDLVYAEFRGAGADAYSLYDNFIGGHHIFSAQTKSIDIYCNGTKYRLGVSFDSSTNTLTLSNSDTSLHLTIMIAGIKINSLPRTFKGEVENPGLS